MSRIRRRDRGNPIKARTGIPIYKNLEKNLVELQRRFPHAPDLVVRRFRTKTGVEAALVYLENMVDKNSVNDQLLEPLMYELSSIEELDRLDIPVGNMETTSRWAKAESAIFDGVSVVLLEGVPSALLFYTQGWPQRAIQEPEIESTLKGGHQGLIETASQNLALIRRYLNHRELEIREYTVGIRGKIKVYLLSLRDVTKPEFVTEMENRIQRIEVDAVINMGELEEYIEDHPYSLFPQFLQTERPDNVVSQLLQGRVAVLMDRAPFALIGPITFTAFFQNVDDYSTRWPVSSFLRLFRFFAFFIATTFPAIYIAVVSYHYEVLPLDLLLSIGISRALVPFPPILEALLMEGAIEMIREAGVRLPAPIGQTIGVVGGIVIGQAAVQAGIVSNIMVIIVAITAIASFIIPNHDLASAIRLVRFPIMLFAAFFGMVGLMIGLMIVTIHIHSLESLGQPFGSPIAPIRLRDWKDTWIRIPLRRMNTRPLATDPKQNRRQERTGQSED
ncbi:spore germination protein [Desmospora profundinema]|uniref:Spore germination protein n=1 Tax=Desmospora profundinema TaxID=1571184 RepID=A0ABU1ITU2_9BACL|nr:spore germination protein [Desmospora profundinema]MDR6227339.1 spore germination protein [Desmospora profundinema]